ncbi:MAG: Gfo/Idh/MocA family oxidoreductase [Mangrovibacterium sp.]
MKNFALAGAAGYIAERHMRAVRETGNRIVAATDLFDVMGRMDSYFPEAEFFTDPGDFEAWLGQHRGTEEAVDYLSICTPNHEHSSYILTALRHGADAICEKPLVLYPAELDTVEKAERESGHRVYNILQLRLHPAIVALREQIRQGGPEQMYNIDLSYITSRGKWYFQSWKADWSKSGSLATNIGIHFFDMLQWIFGEVKQNTVHLYEHHRAAGYLELKQGRVRWYLSLDYNDVPPSAKEKGLRTYRSITVNGQEIEFSGGFTDLHTQAYQQILIGNGFGLSDARPCILLTDAIRNSKPAGLKGDYHPFLKH